MESLVSKAKERAANSSTNNANSTNSTLWFSSDYVETNILDWLFSVWSV